MSNNGIFYFVNMFTAVEVLIYLLCFGGTSYSGLSFVQSVQQMSGDVGFNVVMACAFDIDQQTNQEDTPTVDPEGSASIYDTFCR